MEATNEVHCECGDILGEACAWVGPVTETVVVEYMPEYLRGQHGAAGNIGSYPTNGSLRCRVERSCADVVTHDNAGEVDPWVRIVE